MSTGSSIVGSGGAAALALYGTPFTGGQYNLGPVDYSETQWHNACAPSTKYPAQVQAVEGQLLAGLWDGIPNTAGYCDACIWVTTPTNKSSLLRVVTYGDTTMNSIDVSQQAYSELNTGEYPRTMTWQFAECPDTGPMMYEFQTASSQYWTSLWVRNARVPLTKVEVMSSNHASWAPAHPRQRRHAHRRRRLRQREVLDPLDRGRRAGCHRRFRLAVRRHRGRLPDRQRQLPVVFRARARARARARFS